MRPIGRRQFLGTLAGAGGALALGLAGPGRLGAAPRRRPNIVLIMADDMGFSDVGCYGGEIRTPNLDRLAARGVRFSQFYNAARCCPTRASVLTGLYPHQAGVGLMTAESTVPGYLGQLDDRCVTVAEALGASGYRTGMSGKWHLSRTPVESKAQPNFESNAPFWDTKASWPTARGFDEFYGTIGGANSYWDPFTLVHNETVVRPGSDDYYYTDAISDHAAATIEKHARGDAPFFHYVAYTAPHWPLHARPEDIARYEGRYDAGWDALREERHARQLAMGLLDPRWPLTPRNERARPWSEARNREWDAHRMAVYAAMVDSMDQGIGRILAALERSGAAEDTLVLFLSDNGACDESVSERYPAIPTRTRDGRAITIGNDPAVRLGPDTTYGTYGVAWANAGNTPFRYFKKWIHEGGIATPLIAAWPAGMAGARGAIVHDVAHVSDIMATCLDAAGAAYPEAYQGRTITPMEGRSLLPVLQGGSRTGHELLAWEHTGNRAVRQGNWKLVSRHRRGWELYDMESDRTELHDLAASQPRRVRELEMLYDHWAGRIGVLPIDEYRRRSRAP